MDRDQIVEIFRTLVSDHDGIEVKGAKSKYTAVNGNMFAFVSPEGQLCLRLSEAGKKEFNARHGGTDVIQYNAVMRGYVAVPEIIIGDKDALDDLFAEVVAHARDLKPKPTKNPNKS